MMESCVLEGGISGWATAGEEYVEMIDGSLRVSGVLEVSAGVAVGAR